MKRSLKDLTKEDWNSLFPVELVDHNPKWKGIYEKEKQLDILVMLTPRSGHTDPPKDFGQRDKIMTILQFFSKTFPLQFYSMGSMYQSI